MTDDSLKLGKVLDQEAVTRIVQIMGRTSAAEPGRRRVINRDRVCINRGNVIRAEARNSGPWYLAPHPRPPVAELRINTSELRYYETARDDLLWLCGIAESLAARLDAAQTNVWGDHAVRLIQKLVGLLREVGADSESLAEAEAFLERS
jgi:hypothetical protein